MRDADVRRAVKTWLAAEHGHEHDARLVEEMGVWSGSVRIDVALINGSLSGYELKSDSDTLERLPRQSAIYGRVFDYLYLVVGEKHAEKARALLPDWWGVKVAVQCKTGVELLPYRPPSLNPSPDPYLIAEMLSKEEAVGVLDRFDLARGWRSKKVRLIHERLARELGLQTLKDEVRAALKVRPRCFMVHPFGPVQCDGSHLSSPNALDLPALFLPPRSGQSSHQPSNQYDFGFYSERSSLRAQ